MKLSLDKWRDNIIAILRDIQILNKLDKNGEIYINNDELKMNEDCLETLKILKMLNVLKQALENLEKQIKESLYFQMDGKVKIYEDEDFVIKCTWKKEKKNRFDITAFKNDHPELYQQYIKTEDVKGYVNIYTKEGE